jgi:hypothetical protein
MQHCRYNKRGCASRRLLSFEGQPQNIWNNYDEIICFLYLETKQLSAKSRGKRMQQSRREKIVLIFITPGVLKKRIRFFPKEFREKPRVAAPAPIASVRRAPGWLARVVVDLRRLLLRRRRQGQYVLITISS